MIDFTNSYYYIGLFIACLINYLIGSLNWSLIIGKIFYKTDVRKYYSKNAGATNTNRKLGTKIALLVLLLDSLKVGFGMILTFCISLITIKKMSFAQISYYIPVIFIALGHAYPIYFKFKGGKCASTVIGFTLFINPIYFLILFVTYWTILLITKYVSIASIFTIVIIGILIWIPYLSGLNNFINTTEELANNKLLYFNLLHKFTTPYNGKIYYDNLLTINITLEIILIFTLILHIPNIKRLLKKQEYKFQFKKTKEKKN